MSYAQRPYQRPPGAPPTQQQQQHYGYQTQQQPVQNYSRPAVPPPSQFNYQRPTYAPTAPTNHMQSQQISGTSQYQNFQYSSCNGRKKALLIGVNYIGSSNALRGCINDVRNMCNFLCSTQGYNMNDIVILTDDQADIRKVPTRANMLRAMQWLVQGAQANDSLFFHYSGHGGRTKDLDGDEADGYDDVIYPVDFQSAGHITDDIMHDIMVRPLMPGVRLTALFDSCHSGTALDLPYMYRAQDGQIKEYNMWKDAGGDAMNAIMGYATGNISMLASSATSLFGKLTTGMSGNSSRVQQQKMSAADVISFSGCKDDQTSADTTEAGQSTGAMSWAFISVLSQQPVQSYLTLLQNVRRLLSAKYSQKPQLSSSHPIDVNLKFIM